MLLLLLQIRFSRVHSALPQRRQPTRLPCPWDSPGKNTGVGCHFLLQCRKVKRESEVTQSCLTFSDPMDCSLPGFSVHGIFQARGLEWGAISTTNEYYLTVKNYITKYHHPPSPNCYICRQWKETEYLLSYQIQLNQGNNIMVELWSRLVVVI